MLWKCLHLKGKHKPRSPADALEVNLKRIYKVWMKSRAFLCCLNSLAFYLWGRFCASASSAEKSATKRWVLLYQVKSGMRINTALFLSNIMFGTAVFLKKEGRNPSIFSVLLANTLQLGAQSRAHDESFGKLLYETPNLTTWWLSCRVNWSWKSMRQPLLWFLRRGSRARLRIRIISICFAAWDEKLEPLT